MLGFCCCFFVACASYHQAPQPIQSENDSRQYKALTLSNQLRVLLISDPKAEKAAASLDLNVGSRQDPEQSEGLAHFLEHMLFLGTKKYPEAGVYQAFISEHGGRHNAYTAFEHTNYFFDIEHGDLEPALDRFAQFFIAPLFTEEYVEREKNAVNSEFTSKLKNDARKSLDVYKSVINPEHPFAKFSVGNLDTLSSASEGELRKELITFYERYYSANIMTLVVVGRESLPQLQQWVEERFEKIPNRKTQVGDVVQPLFVPGTLPMQVQIKPEQEQRVLSLNFPVGDLREYYRQKPLAYIGNILGHEGEGSLFSYLKARGWVESLSAGAGFSYQGGSAFGLNIKLTPAGYLHQDEIIQSVFQAINRIEKEGVKSWLYEEQAASSAIQFRFQESIEPINYSRQLASSMHYYPARDLLRGSYAMDDFDPTLIKQYLSALNPDNMLVTITAPEVTVNKISPYYQTNYSNEAISQDRINSWDSAGLSEAFHLPKPNDFIAKDFGLIESGSIETKDNAKNPALIHDQSGSQWWFKNDEEFNLPKGFLSLSIRSSKASASVEQSVLLRLYSHMLLEQVNEFAYPAYLAGLHYSVSSHMRGLSVKVSGFNEKQPLLFEQLLKTVVNPEFDQQRFERIKADMQRVLENSAKQQPYGMLMGDLPQYLYQQIYTEQQALSVLSAIKLPDLKNYIASFLQQVNLNGLVYGNYSESQAQAIIKKANALFTIKHDGELPSTQIYQLSESNIAIKTENSYQDSSLLYYVQAKNNDSLTRVAFSVAAQLYKPSFYTQLRTEKQLGYIVTSGVYPVHEVPGMFFMLQSPVASAPSLQGEVLGFIEQKLSRLESVDEQQFTAAKQVIMTHLAQKPTSLWESQGRYWQDIAYRYYNFDSRAQLLEALKQLDLAMWKRLIEQHLLSESRHGMWLYSVGKFTDQQTLSAKPIKNIEDFESQRGYYSFP
ncbi:MAG: secreted Zn-dependent insulinase-like peptidase [Pseudohongiellaceae bacterium]